MWDQSGLTLALALTGTFLGVVNTWVNANRDRVKLRVRPVHVIDGSNRSMFGIEVTNLSSFKVSVDDVGFTPSRFRPAKHQRATLSMSIPVSRWFESRESFTYRFDRAATICAVGFKIRAAYAKTSCGMIFTGVTPALRQLANETPFDPTLSRTYST